MLEKIKDIGWDCVEEAPWPSGIVATLLAATALVVTHSQMPSDILRWLLTAVILILWLAIIICTLVIQVTKSMAGHDDDYGDEMTYEERERFDLESGVAPLRVTRPKPPSAD